MSLRSPALGIATAVALAIAIVAASTRGSPAPVGGIERTRPTAPPPAAMALQTPRALVRSRPSAKVVVTIDKAAGETTALVYNEVRHPTIRRL